MTRRGRVLARASVCTLGMALACASWGDASKDQKATSIDGGGFRMGSSSEAVQRQDPCGLLVVEEAPSCDDSRRLVGLPPAQECTAFAGWSHGVITIGDPPKAQSFCVYEQQKGANPGEPEWNDALLPAAGTASKVKGSASTSAGPRWQPDCAVSLQGEDPLEVMEGTWGSRQRDWFGLSAQTAAAVGARAEAEGLQPVRVAVIDTAGPLQSGAGGRHGYLMAEIVKQVSFGQVKVLTYAGLPRERSDAGALVDQGGALGPGGSLGYVSDVARAIEVAVDQWRDEEPDAKLIINLSLAWRAPSSMCGGGRDAAPSHDPLYAAIERANDLGALVLVASGNEPALACAGPEPELFAPACWEQYSGATSEASPYAPLVYAISPVDYRDRSLSMSPERTYTHHAAYGYQGTFVREAAEHDKPKLQIDRALVGERAARVGDGSGSLTSVYGYSPGASAAGALEPLDLGLVGSGSFDAPLAAPVAHDEDKLINGVSRLVAGPMSGSSVSTAVESGLAGLVWALAPDLDAPGVMHHLWTTGKPIADGTEAALALNSSLGRQRKVGARCLALNPFFEDNLQCEDAVLEGQTFSGLWDHESPFSREGEELVCELKCGEETQVHYLTVNAESPGALPDSIVRPQPDLTPCPPCYIDDDDEPEAAGRSVYVKFGEDFEGMTFEGVMITIFSESRAQFEEHYYWASELSLVNPFEEVNVFSDPALNTVTNRSGVGEAELEVVDAEIRVDFQDPTTGQTVGAEALLPVESEAPAVPSP